MGRPRQVWKDVRALFGPTVVFVLGGPGAGKGGAKAGFRSHGKIIELDDGKIYRKALYLMVKTMVSCRFSLKPIH
jgi:hypothetical protein